MRRDLFLSWWPESESGGVRAAIDLIKVKAGLQLKAQCESWWPAELRKTADRRENTTTINTRLTGLSIIKMEGAAGLETTDQLFWGVRRRKMNKRWGERKGGTTPPA